MIMYILGIHSIESLNAHDPAACILKNGKLIAAAEEERFVRIKHARGYFPSNSVRCCLQEADIKLDDVGYISIPWNAEKYPHKIKEEFSKISSSCKKDKNTIAWESKQLKELTSGAFKNRVEENLKNMGKLPEVRWCPHHLSHATASYYSSGFNDAAILSIDGHGDEHTTVLWHAVDDEIIPIKEFKVPNSIGWFYAALTEYLGFESNSGEGKLMGLAPYGRENKKIESIFDKILKIKEDGYDLNQCFIFYGKHSYNPRFTDRLVDELGKHRNKNNKISEKHKNIAYSTQNKLENAMLRLSEIIKNKTGSENLCISGGVGLNCKANQKIRENGIFKEIFIHPAPHEPSAAIGSSFLLYKELTGKIANNKIEHAYLGLHIQMIK